MRKLLVIFCLISIIFITCDNSLSNKELREIIEIEVEKEK